MAGLSSYSVGQHSKVENVVIKRLVDWRGSCGGQAEIERKDERMRWKYESHWHTDAHIITEAHQHER